MESLKYRRIRRKLVGVASNGYLGRLIGKLAAFGLAPYHTREILAKIHPKGFVDPHAYLSHPRVKMGTNVYIGKDVSAFADPGEGSVDLGDHVSIYGRSLLRTGASGDIRVGDHTHIQMGCTMVACISPIVIGAYVEIAPDCAFYSCTHGIAPNELIMKQDLESKGPIEIGDGAWLGNRVTVLQGVSIGAGAVIGAGSVVTKNIPENAIAVGVPAKVVGSR